MSSQHFTRFYTHLATFLLIHGAYGNPDENWFPWLRDSLESEGHQVITPTFPTPENQSLDNWLTVFNDLNFSTDEPIIAIGHSLGPAFILHLLERGLINAKAAFFVAPFIGRLGNPDFDDINATFVDHEFDWEKIKKRCSTFTVYYADNDPYVPMSEGLKVAENLGIEPTLIDEAEHFNEAAGYLRFERLLKDIHRLPIK